MTPEQLAEVYDRIGLAAFLVVVTVSVLLPLFWHLGHLAKLLVQHRLNGKVALEPAPIAIPAPECPWSEKLSREWDAVVEGMKSSAHGSQMFEESVWPAFLRGDMQCKWTEETVRELITEMRLLRRELELTRNGRGNDRSS